MNEKYIPALRFSFLTRFYDILVAWTTREVQFRSLMLNYFKLEPGATLLDLACGTGSLLQMVSQLKKDCYFIGLDGDLTILEMAKRKNVELLSANSVKFVHAFADKTGIESGSVDVISTSLFFHHLRDPVKRDVLREIKRILKNDGRFVFCDWDAPENIFEKFAFFIVRCLDGFEVTRASYTGEIETLLQNEFPEIKKVESISVPLGRISIWVSCI